MVTLFPCSDGERDTVVRLNTTKLNFSFYFIKNVFALHVNFNVLLI